MTRRHVGVRRRGLLAAGSIGLSGCAAWRADSPVFADADWRHAERLRDAALQDREAWGLLHALCTQIGARPAGSAADARAIAWAQERLQALGLQRVRAEPFGLKVWQRGPASADLVRPAPEALVVAALGNSVATPSKGLEADVAWFPDLAALKADAGDRARGRIVVVGQATARTRDGSGYGAAIAARTQGAGEAARRGALAYGVRSLGTSGERVAHTGAMTYPLDAPAIPAFALSVPDAERMAALHAAGAPLRLRLMLDARVGVDATSANVIGEIPGTDLADQVVMISAHLDSWDVGQGAVDDGAGVAIVCAAAGLIARGGRPPRRTVRVVLFGNEENGFAGARDYGNRHGRQPHQWVGESDFGAGRPWQLRARVRADALPLVARMADLLAPLGVDWPAQGANEGIAGPDAAVLARRFGWPMVQVHQDGSAYFDVHHTVHDTLDRVDPATLPPNVAVWAVSTWLAAQSPRDFFPRS